MNVLWVARGSAAGGMARYACAGIGARWPGGAIPWGTLFVNVTGSLLIGILAVAVPEGTRWLGTDARALLMIGLCGGFTTFSSFSLQTLALMREGDWLHAAAYTLGSVVLCIGAAAAGYATTTSVLGR